MMQELWKSFPREIEYRIGRLLDEAIPNSTKAFQLYKACQNEGLWSESFEKFSNCLNDFFTVRRVDRSKGQFDGYLNRPMDFIIYEDFYLNFKSADISKVAIRDLAGWAHNLMRVHLKTESEIISVEVLNKALVKVTSPISGDKVTEILFEDFCQAWNQVVKGLFGLKHDTKMQFLLRDLQRLDQQARHHSQSATDTVKLYNLGWDFTQTEIDWTNEIAKKAFVFASLPKFPLSKGPQKLVLIELERMTTLYSIILLTDNPQLLQHKENIRATILDRCEKLLKIKSAA